MITLNTLEQATAQEVFDQVARHLIIQGKQCRIGSECAYRGPDGLKCAAGCLIGDDEYQRDFEGLVWRKLVIDGVVPDIHWNLIESLQWVHDRCVQPTWRQELKQVAENFGLEFRG